jgi:hypothetical protein
MVKQYVYVDTFAKDSSDLITTSGDYLRMNINSLIKDIPPYINVSIVQIEYISPDDLVSGVVLKIKADSANQLNLNKVDSALCLLEYSLVKNAIYFYKNHRNKFYTTLGGNTSQLEIYFADSIGNVIPLANKEFMIVLEIETPDVGELTEEYRRAIPLPSRLQR